MAIYIDISAAVHGRAGLGRYAESLARALVQKDPERFAFFYIPYGWVGTEEQSPKGPATRVE